MREPQDSTGRAIAVGDRVNWRGQIYTIKAFSGDGGRFGTRAIEFVETLHLEGEVPDEISVDLVQTESRTRCPWCGGDCPRWGADACPMRPHQFPRTEEP